MFRHRAHALFHALLLAALSSLPAGAADPLSQLVCPNGSPDYSPLDVVTWTPGLGTPLRRRTVSDPSALCNDGTPAVFFMRPAQAQQAGEMADAAAPSSKWWIHFPGGGSCNDVQACYERWCSLDGKVFSRAGKMSSAGAPPAVVDFGPFDRTPPAPFTNDFAGWNHVVLHYCSSDLWSGSARHQGVATNGGEVYDVDFRGAAIVDAIFDLLRSGPISPDPDPTGQMWNAQLPDLDNATEVIISGESAGSAGVRFHIDELEATLAANGTRVEAVLDAGLPATLDDPGWVWGPDSPGSYAGVAREETMPSRRYFHGQDDDATDASCIATPALPNIGTAECFDAGVVLERHISTPFFQRMDISDPLPQDRYIAWGLAATLDDYIQANADELNALPATAVPAAVDVGVMGSHCGDHIALTNNVGFYLTGLQTAPLVKGPSFHDLVSDWYGGAAVLEVQPNFSGAWATSPSLDCQ